MKVQIASVLIVAIAAAVLGCSTPVPVPKEPASLPSTAAPAAAVSPPTVSPTIKAPSNGLTQSSTGGAVTISVGWKGEMDGLLVFEISMNTHSVDLDRYDFGELATLRDDGGAEYRPASWRSAPGGHHRSGTLTFPIPNSIGREEAKHLQLIIRDVSGVKERVMKWEL